MNEDFMWEAVERCDSKYDGLFFYAVKTTNIFCRPSCKSRTPDRKNVLFFKMSREAINHGFRPCKRCRPDLHELPDEREVVAGARDIIEKEYSSPITLEKLSKEVGMSKYYLQRTFKEKVGLTPNQYIARMRLTKSKELLKESSLSILQIAYEVGYRSSSHFNVMFRQHYGCSPTDYRKICHRENI
ncbi:bifunctional transcriptional activator/DNA repair enzyme AdaA [Bacillus sp. T33-2]|uniref:bifunctional transcriptional activator/DNA repair enzyme AdaA n=1 Tax=Bacillus sp. T33-2 TaxID=2054168 RepID=UPI000C76C3EA|nr:Ada metal-binding domain-containing protein [Bacillus sp. T33-2]PLR95271.1 hypothetical protein CVD19_14965 [Bacillus sp. T33-2]